MDDTLLNPGLLKGSNEQVRWYVNHPYLTFGRTFGNPVL